MKKTLVMAAFIALSSIFAAQAQTQREAVPQEPLKKVQKVESKAKTEKSEKELQSKDLKAKKSCCEADKAKDLKAKEACKGCPEQNKKLTTKKHGNKTAKARK